MRVGLLLKIYNYNFIHFPFCHFLSFFFDPAGTHWSITSLCIVSYLAGVLISSGWMAAKAAAVSSAVGFYFTTKSGNNGSKNGSFAPVIEMFLFSFYLVCTLGPLLYHWWGSIIRLRSSSLKICNTAFKWKDEFESSTIILFFLTFPLFLKKNVIFLPLPNQLHEWEVGCILGATSG